MRRNKDPRQGELIQSAEIAQALLNVSPRPSSGLSRWKFCVIRAPGGYANHVHPPVVRWLPAARGISRNADFNPGAGTFSAVWASSVTVSTVSRRSVQRARRYGAGAAEKGRVPVVVPLLNRAIKQHPFVGNICGPRRGCAQRDPANRSSAASAPASIGSLRNPPTVACKKTRVAT